MVKGKKVKLFHVTSGAGFADIGCPTAKRFPLNLRPNKRYHSIHVIAAPSAQLWPSIAYVYHATYDPMYG